MSVMAHHRNWHQRIGIVIWLMAMKASAASAKNKMQRNGAK